MVWAVVGSSFFVPVDEVANEEVCVNAIFTPLSPVPYISTRNSRRQGESLRKPSPRSPLLNPQLSTTKTTDSHRPQTTDPTTSTMTDQVRTAHLLIKHTSSRNPVSRRTGEAVVISPQQAMTELQQYEARIKQEGIDSAFPKYAAERSDCSSCRNNGYVVWSGWIHIYSFWLIHCLLRCVKCAQQWQISLYRCSKVFNDVIWFIQTRKQYQ